MIRNFPGANVKNMQHNLMPIIRKKPSHLVIHAGANDAKKFTSMGDFGSIPGFKKNC